MIPINEIRNGMTIVLENNLYTVVWFQHVKPGKGGAFVKTRLKNIKTGAVLEKTFRSNEEIEKAHLEQATMEYLYKDGDKYWFMDHATYEQHPFDKDIIGDEIRFLKENMQVEVTYFEGNVVGAEIPMFVELKVTTTEPGFKGNTVSATNKPATVETGAIVQVPLFIKEGDVIKIDTRTGEYIQRV